MKSILIGIGCACLLGVSLVIATGVLEGRSPAERAATTMVMPIGMLWLSVFAGCIASYLCGHRRTAAILLIGWGMIGVTFNGYVADKFLSSVQYSVDSIPSESFDPPLDAIVLLGGYASDNQFGVAELRFDGQRFLLAGQLWHAGKTRTIICTGTGISGGRDPSQIGRELLESIAVPGEVIFEVSGENTAGEMRSLKRFFETPPDDWVALIPDAQISDSEEITNGASPARPVVGLVTSATHLPRALRLARDHDLDFVPLPCLLAAASPNVVSPRQLIPSAGAGKKFAIALKECLAELVGR